MKKYLLVILGLITVVLVTVTIVIMSQDKSEIIEEEPPETDEDRTINPTGEYLLSKGQTDYKVLLPTEASNLELFASTELVEIFFEATGVSLEVINDEDFSPEDSYISVGQTTLKNENEDLFENEDFGISGFLIWTSENNIILSGQQEEGSLYAVYEFLYLILNFEVFDESVYSLNRGVSNIELMEYQIIDIPDIEIRAANYGYLEQNIKLSRRLRFEGLYDRFVDFFGAAHNATRVITRDQYYDLHPEWFANEKGNQLSYTAKGDEEKLELLVSTVADKMKQALMADTTKTIIAFTHDDFPDWDESDATQSEYNKYGTHAAAVVKFINKVRYKIDDWFASDEGKPYDRDLTIYFFAYLQTMIPPVRWDDTLNTYVPIDEDVILADGVAPWIAPLTADYTRDFEHINNKDTLEMIDGWKALGTDVLMWSYSTNFHHYLVPFDTFNSMQNIYKKTFDIESYIMFDQGQANNYQQPTGWSKLKVYLNSKLSWNVDVNIDKLVEKFFANYFGPAKEDMLNWFNEYRLHSAFLNDTNSRYSGSNSIFLNSLRTEFFPKRLLDQWRNYALNALDAIEHIKDENLKLYEVYRDNIRLEKLSIDYISLALYRNAGVFTDGERQTRLEEFYKESLYFNIQRLNEMEDISEIYRNWGLN